MADFARPELIATPEWLADNLGRPDVRVVDVRWRPDGTAAQLHAAGHVPGAVHLDWQTSVVVADRGRGHAAPRLARSGWRTRWRRPGWATGRPSCSTTTRSRYHAARAWWSLRAYGFETARVLDGGYPAWARGRLPDRAGGEVAAPARFTPRLQARRHVTTADVRGLLGAPDVLLVDARGPAEFHGYEGNVRRLGHIPGAVNVPVAAMHLPGTPAAARPGRAPGPPAQGQHHPRPAPRLLRPVRRGGGEARLGAVAPRPRGRRRVRRRLGGLGRPDGPARSTSSARRRDGHAVARRVRTSARPVGASARGSSSSLGRAASTGPAHRGRPRGRPPGAGPGSASGGG